MLSAYKILTVGICVGLLFRLRRRIESEIAAWVAVAILAVMAMQWAGYAYQLQELERLQLAGAGSIPTEVLHLD